MISIFNKDTKKNIEFSKINLLFGYAKSGKTYYLSFLNNIFTGKDKHNLVNGTQTIPGDFNVFFLGSKDGIKEHLKLSSKSLLRKMIMENQFSKDFEYFCDLITKGFLGAQAEIEEMVRSVLPKTRLDTSDAEKPLELLLDNMNISLEMDSSTEEKEELFALVNTLAKTTNTKTIVLIDDFNNDLDEEATLHFFSEIKNSEAIFFLTTKKPVPQSIIDENTKIFSIRENKIKAVPPLETLILESQELKEENHSFEEYLLGQGYMKESAEYKLLIKTIRNDENVNLLRILTSKSPAISQDFIDKRVTIIPKNNYEEKLYRYIFSLLEIDIK